jgi:pectate lyase
MFATGGRGGKVLAVTTLDDSGPGSLREAISTEGPRTIVFRVGGVIRLQSDLNIDHPDITVAGQTAPGDGICLADATLNINTHNVILRHLRVRLTENRTPERIFIDCIGGNPEGNIIVDHCTTSWGTDESLSLYRYMQPRPDLPRDENGEIARQKLPTHNVTVQWCLISESLVPATHGSTWGGQDSTFHHNLFASNGGRNPSIGMSGEFDYRNNVIFNWEHRTIDGGDETSLVNVINNYFKPGPATTEAMHQIIARIEQREMFSPGKRWEEQSWYQSTGERPGKWYIAGNLVEGHDEVTRDNWKGTRGPAELARVSTPFEAWPMHQESAMEAYHSVLARSGATLPRRDAIDDRIVESVRTGEVGEGNGIIRHPDEVGGLIGYGFDPDEVPIDTDHDGMPDGWEEAHALNPKNGDDHAEDADNDGYTNLEEFLNGTDPQEFVDYRNFDNNVDTIS